MSIDLMSGRSVTRSVEDGLPRSSDPLIAPKGYFNVRAPECDGSLGLSYPVTANTPDITHAIEYLWYRKGSASGDLRDMESRPPDATYLILLSLKKPKP